MGIFDRFFKRKSIELSEKADLSKSENKKPYTPDQKEPEEYIAYFTEISRFYKEAQPFSYPIMVVGFEDESTIAQILSGTKKLALKGTLKEKKFFDQRNPVIKIEYPLVALSPENEADLVKDTKELRKSGASDISAIGISMTVAEKLRSVFGEKSCPFLSVLIHK